MLAFTFQLLLSKESQMGEFSVSKVTLSMNRNEISAFGISYDTHIFILSQDKIGPLNFKFTITTQGTKGPLCARIYSECFTNISLQRNEFPFGNS